MTYNLFIFYLDDCKVGNYKRGYLSYLVSAAHGERAATKDVVFAFFSAAKVQSCQHPRSFQLHVELTTHSLSMQTQKPAKLTR